MKRGINMDAEKFLEFIKSRRSIRQFEQKQISEEELQMILEAGLYAPNAGSRQSAIFLVTQEKDVIETLGKINRETFNPKPGRHVNNAQPSIIDKPEMVSAFYGAPTLITFLAPKNFLYGEADCSVCLENMLLMAHALGIGGCMIGRAKETMNSEYGRNLLKSKGIDDKYNGYYHLVLGYPKGDTFVKERKERIYR
jgi:nitroreductase